MSNNIWDNTDYAVNQNGEEEQDFTTIIAENDFPFFNNTDLDIPFDHSTTSGIVSRSLSPSLHLSCWHQQTNQLPTQKSEATLEDSRITVAAMDVPSQLEIDIPNSLALRREESDCSELRKLIESLPSFDSDSPYSPPFFQEDNKIQTKKNDIHLQKEGFDPHDQCPAVWKELASVNDCTPSKDANAVGDSTEDRSRIHRKRHSSFKHHHRPRNIPRLAARPLIETLERDILRIETKRRGCSCKKSMCLKKYCECFSAGQYCSNSVCICKKCRNCPGFEDERQKAILAALNRNPLAFCDKIQVRHDPRLQQRKHDLPYDAVHLMGCKCKKSGCLKNYCECYSAKVHCNGNCKCVECKNMKRGV